MKHIPLIISPQLGKGLTDLLRSAYEKYNANPRHVDAHGRSPLHLAARGGRMDTYNFLVSLGLDTKASDEKGDNLIHYASSGGSLEVLNAVLNEGITSSQQSEQWTPLHWACRAEEPKIVERLIQEGLRSNCIPITQPEGKWSPAAIAIFHGNEKILEGLPASCRSLLGEETETARLHGSRHGGYSCDGCFYVSESLK